MRISEFENVAEVRSATVCATYVYVDKPRAERGDASTAMMLASEAQLSGAECGISEHDGPLWIQRAHESAPAVLTTAARATSVDRLRAERTVAAVLTPGLGDGNPDGDDIVPSQMAESVAVVATVCAPT